LRDQAIAACADIAASNRHATSLETLKYMVAAGEGCTLMPALAVTKIKGLDYVPLPGSDHGRTIVLAWRRSDPRAKEFNDLASNLLDFYHPDIARMLPSSNMVRGPNRDRKALSL
jgi:LysR family transcriptional regulator, hydrogen peroxide-inducible genes activator